MELRYETLDYRQILRGDEWQTTKMFAFICGMVPACCFHVHLCSAYVDGVMGKNRGHYRRSKFYTD